MAAQGQQNQGYAGYPAPPGQGQPAGGAPPQVQYAQPGQQQMQGVYLAGGGAQMGMQGQQQQIQYMPKPNPIPGCPPGLEYLTQIDQLLVHQQIELFEMFTNWETSNRYQVKNSMGQQVYFASEESETCHRQCCGPNRGFVMHISDNAQQEVIRIVREFKCCAGCNCCAACQCCQMEVTVEAPVGTVVGTFKQQLSCLAPKYVITDSTETPVLEVEGPVCICQGPCCTWDQEFVVRNMSGQEVGKISKQWSGFVREMFTQADNFGVSFPMDLDVKIKAVMIGAVFLIDFMFFEQKNNNNR